MLAALGLGSNTGAREPTLRFAAACLSRYLRDPSVSSLYLTQPLHQPAQPDFLNIALAGYCMLDAEELLGLAKGLEWMAGRRRGARFGPRPLDIDLLVMGDQWSRRPELSVPHPRLRVRRFALAPLAEIAPDLKVPPDGSTVAELLREIGGAQPAERRDWTTAPFQP